MGKCNANAERYLREIKSCLPCSRKEKQKILDIIRVTIDEYLSENPDAGDAEIKARFGDPQQIASAYINEKETEDLLSSLKIKRKICGIVLATASIVAVLWTGFLTVAYFDHTENMDGYLVIEEIEVENRTVIDEGGKLK